MCDLRQIDIDLDLHHTIEAGRISFSETDNDILRRLLGIGVAQKAVEKVPKIADAVVSRVRGKWKISISGTDYPAGSLIEAYKTLLDVLAAKDSHFLERFSEEGTWARRYVAREPSALYINSPNLVGYAHRLNDGWYYDANLSEIQIIKRAKIACAMCGMNFGRDVAIMEGDRAIH